MELYENADRTYARELAEAGRRDMNDKCANCGYHYNQHYDDGKCPAPVIRHSEPVQDMADARKAELEADPQTVDKDPVKAYIQGYQKAFKASRDEAIQKVEAVKAGNPFEGSPSFGAYERACDDILKALRGEK